jgi:glycosyltransferase involved in cell wall biosynthesis
MPRSGAARTACFTLWFPAQNNRRYASLLPRLASVVDVYRWTLSRSRLLRGIEYRLWRRLKRRLIYPLVLRRLARRYDSYFCVDVDQVAAWPRPDSLIIDIDDPTFEPDEIDLLRRPQVKAIVVTTEKSRAVLHERGVDRPIHVIPQGVALDDIDPNRVERIRRELKRDTGVVIGYHAPTLTMAADGRRRWRAGMDDLDLLFDAVDEARKTEPRIRLWLIGEASRALKQYADDKPWISLFGYVVFRDILPYVSNFDVAVYPRTFVDRPGRFRLKIAEYMACGVPVVSTDLDEAFIVRDAACGIVCHSTEEFARALIELARSAEARVQLGEAGRQYARAHLDWSLLARRYRELF